MSNRPAKPDNMPWLTPCLTVKDADAAVAFYEKAFGFTKRFSMPGPDGRTAHAEVAWRDGLFMIGPECADHSSKSPATTGVRPSSSLYVYCDDVDALFNRAKAAGAAVETPPKEMFWGDKVCMLTDPDGYRWWFATNVADFDPANAPQKCEAGACCTKQ
ncbi:MAG: VOC family protein [Thermoguttaceae bacterium]